LARVRWRTSAAAAGEPAPQRPGPLVGTPDLGQKPGVEQLAERPGVELVGLHLRLGDRPQLARVGDRDAADVGLDEALDPQRRSGRLERHLVVGRQALGEQPQLLGAGFDAPRRAHLGAVLDRHLAEIAVDVQRDRSHVASFDCVAETQRANDTDGFVLAAQPDKSQGRPLSSSGSRPIP